MKENYPWKSGRSLFPVGSWGPEIDQIDSEAENNPRIGERITVLMAGPDLHIGVDRVRSNNAEALLTQLEYQGKLGGGTPSRAFELNTNTQLKKSSSS
jgi:hypothetical protein